MFFCVLILIFILPITFLPELEDFFSSDELAEMGISHQYRSTT